MTDEVVQDDGRVRRSYVALSERVVDADGAPVPMGELVELTLDLDAATALIQGGHLIAVPPPSAPEPPAPEPEASIDTESEQQS